MNSKRTNRSNANSNTDRHDLRGQDFEFKDEFKNVNDSGLKHLIEDQKKQAEESRKSKDIQHPDQDIEELER
ncbi:MAG: hypothetical protein QW112_04135, partial [Candidatus Micrarchaeia archaeon]